MAILGNKNGVNAEITFTKKEGSYIYYSFRFFYGRESLFNPSILERDTVRCDEYDGDSFIPFLEGILENDQPASWWPLEWDIWVEVVPQHLDGLDATLQNPNVVYTSPEQKEKLKGIDERRKALGGKLPEDWFDFTFLSNKQLNPEDDSELAVRITVTREELEAFVDELKKEYKDFLEREAAKKLQNE